MLDAWVDSDTAWSDAAVSWQPAGATAVVSTAAIAVSVQTATVSSAVAVAMETAQGDFVILAATVSLSAEHQTNYVQLELATAETTTASNAIATAATPQISFSIETAGMISPANVDVAHSSFQINPVIISNIAQFHPSESADDGHWFVSGNLSGNFYNSSNDVVFGNHFNGNLDAFFRFEINIPENSKIISAYPKFTAQRNTTGLFNVNIYFVNAYNPSAPTTASQGNLLSLTSAINWNDNTGWIADSVYTGPNISTIFQEVIDREDYSPGSHIVLIVKENSSNSQTARHSYSYDYSASSCISLDVTWESANAGQSIVSVSAVNSSINASSATVATNVIASTNASGLSLSAKQSSVTLDIPDVTVSVYPATASIFIQPTTVQTSCVASVECVSAILSLGVSESSVTTIAEPEGISLGLTTGAAAVKAETIATANACAVTWLVQSAVVAPVVFSVDVVGLLVAAGPAAVFSQITALLEQTNLTLVVHSASVSSENTTSVPVAATTASCMAYSATATCGCVANLDAVDLSLISQATVGKPHVDHIAGAQVILSAARTGGVTTATVANLLTAQAAISTRCALGSPHVSQDINAVDLDLTLSSVAMHGAVLAETNAVVLTMALKSISAGTGVYEISHFVTPISTTDRFNTSFDRTNSYHLLIDKRSIFKTKITTTQT